MPGKAEPFQFCFLLRVFSTLAATMYEQMKYGSFRGQEVRKMKCREVELMVKTGWRLQVPEQEPASLNCVTLTMLPILMAMEVRQLFCIS